MKVTDDVLNDLLTVYLAGEASADTRALIETHARQNPAFAAKLEAARGLPLVDPQPGNPATDLELRALAEVRQFIRLRTLFCAGGMLFTLLPLVFTFDERGVEFPLLGRHPGIVWACWSVAVASWVAWFVMHRQVRQAGL